MKLDENLCFHIETIIFVMQSPDLDHLKECHVLGI